MKSLRRSFNGGKDHHYPSISTPIPSAVPGLPSVSKPSASFTPPTKVIRALGEHRKEAADQLSFSKGDFFHVVRDKDENWYEANNPVTGARGLVPKFKFEEFGRSNAASRASQAPPPRSSPSLGSAPKSKVFHAIVQHDFMPERGDELEARQGDNITIVAHSNREWFVAKPIDRLGRPGLIPVSWVTLPVLATGTTMSADEVTSLMERGEIPPVEEWKKAMLGYKAASISLGVIGDEGSMEAVPNSPFMPSPSQSFPSTQQVSSHQQAESRPPSPPPCLPPGIIMEAEVVSWHHEMGEYWFRISALFQPDIPAGSNSLPPAKQAVLFRVYNDFYDFQVKLLNAFPYEAGRAEIRGPDGQPQKSDRILPYMPGPAENENDEVTDLRRGELHDYLVELCGLWQRGYDPILRHQLVREFFTPKPGDVEEDVELPAHMIEERFGKGYGYDGYDQQPNGSAGRELADNRDSRDQLRHPFNQMSVREEDEEDRLSDGSNYEEENDLPPIPSKAASGGPPNQGGIGKSQQAYAPTHQRNGSSSSAYRNSGGPPRYASTSRTQSPISERAPSTQSIKGYPQAGNPSLSRLDTDLNGRQTGEESPRSFYSNAPPTAGSGSSYGRSRSGSNANNPPISASNPNTAFIKVKIFDRLTEELIAIRVNPRVTHEQLIEKVRDRLGGDVQHLSYRDSVSNTFLGVDNDRALRKWLDETDKHILYAD